MFLLRPFFRFFYLIFKKLAGTAGFTMSMQRTNDEYQMIFSRVTYTPWASEASFREIYETIRNNTLVDDYRLYGVWQLVTESAKLPGGALMEVGAWRGGSGALIAKTARLAGIKDTVYLCDTFKGEVKVGDKDTVYKGGEYADTSKEIVEELIEKLGVDNVSVLEGIFPDDTAKFISDSEFRFCHIDVDAYESTKDILEWLWPRLVVGGIIVFNDYGFLECDGVTRYINEMRAEKDRLFVYNLNGTAILIKIPD